MNPPNYMAYMIIGGALLFSLAIPAIVGFADAWWVPLVVLAICLPYLAYDRRLRKREEQARR
jgi:hypothetical protein